ncbi:MAG TPA: tetratricopeptide repeat protein, partial [Gemmataceae bacterium]|nr:tetratricopeptide repeat protein [Gemmataceae bacterium]
QIAEEQKKKAEKSEAKLLADYRDSTDETIEQLIASRPEIGPHEKQYLERILKRWQAYAEWQGNSELERATRAEGHYRVGQIHYFLGQREKALAAYEQARDIGMELSRQFPEEHEYKQSLTGSHINVGVVLSQLGRWQEALVEYERALALAAEILKRLPSDRGCRTLMATTQGNVGALLVKHGQPDKARRALEQSRDSLQQLHDESPDAPSIQQYLAGTCSNLGGLYVEIDNLDAGQKELERARDLQMHLIDRFPGRPRYKCDLAGTCIHLGSLYGRRGDLPRARAQLEQVRNLRQELADQYPAIRDYKSDLLLAHQLLGEMYANSCQWEPACVELELSIVLCKKLLDEDPKSTGYQNMLAYAFERHGEILAARGQMPEALEKLKEALELQKPLAEQFAADADFQMKLAQTHFALARVLVTLRQSERARAEFEQALESGNKAVAVSSGLPIYRQKLSHTYFQLGLLLHLQLRKRDDALKAFQGARELQLNLVKEFAGAREYVGELALTHGQLGALFAECGKPDEARQEYLQGIKLGEQFAESTNSTPDLKVTLGGSYCNYGNFIRDRGNPENSLEWYGKAIKTLTALCERDSNIGNVKQFLRNSHWNRAKALDLLERYADAVPDWTRALDLSPPADQPGMRAGRAKSRLEAGHVTEAIADVAQLTKLTQWNSGQWYYFACFYAVASLQDKSKKLEYADRAMELLRKAVSAGYNDVVKMKDDDDLAALRDRDDFKKLLAELEAKQKESAGPKAGPEKK